jgi:CRP-like cAMP-binding protein
MTNQNRILAALPPNEWSVLEPLLHEERAERGVELLGPGEPVRLVYFPTYGVISQVTVLEDGGSIEGLLCGPEGAIGGSAAWADTTSAWQVLTQSRLEGSSVPVAALRGVIGEMPALQTLLVAYMQVAQEFATQSIACNRFHQLTQRAARWILVVARRLGSDEIEMTQEFMAMMLGVHRPAVTVALQSLQQAELIRSSRGRVRIVDRAALQEVSCECYGRVEAEFDAMMPAQRSEAS